MRSRSSSYMADGSVDDHVPLNRIVVINPDVHESTDISSGETTPTDGEYDAETFFHPGDRPATSEDVAAKFTELLGDASDDVPDSHHHYHQTSGDGLPDVSIRVGGNHEMNGIDNVVTGGPHSFAFAKGIAEGMMDIALLTANANQLRFLLTYNSKSKTYYVSVGLIVASLIIQVAVGIALIFKSQMKIRGNGDRASKTNDFLVGGVFIVTVINVFAAAFTTTDKEQ